MSGVVERLRETVSGLNRETLMRVLTQWRGHGVELLTRLSGQMSQSPFKAFAVIVVVNGLFYTLVSRRLVNLLDNCSKQPDRPQRKIWVGVVVLGSLTALINIAFSKLMQYQLSRIALLGITSSVIFLRLLLNIEVPTLPSRRISGTIPPTADRNMPKQGQTNSSSRPSVTTASSASKPVSNLRDFGYTEADIDLFVKYIGYPEALSRFDAFIQSIPDQGKTLLSTYVEKRELLLAIVSDFQQMKTNCSTSPQCLEKVLTRISTEIFNSQPAELDESVQRLIDRGFPRFQLEHLVAAVGKEHRTNVLGRLLQFVESSDTRASEMNVEMEISLRRMINCFNSLRMGSQQADFDSLQTLDQLFAMYERRFQSEKYHALIERSSQDNIDYFVNLFSEYEKYPDWVQDTILDHLEQHLLPLLTKTVQENQLIVAQIAADFNVSRRNQQVDNIFTARILFEEVCAEYCPLELGRNYQVLIGLGFDGAQLANLVALIGSDHRTKVMERLNRFVQECQNSKHAAAAAIIQDGGKKNSLLLSMINSFNSLKTRSQPTDFDPLETFNHVCSMYQSRLEEENYHALVERCPQEEINSFADLFNEYAEYFYYNQSGIFETFEQHLLPLLTKTVQENQLIVAQIVADFNVSRRNQQVGNIYRARSLFEEACVKYCPLELGSNYQMLIGLGFDGAQLATLVALIGNDHRTEVMERLNRFVQECQNSEHAAASAMIQDGEKKNSLLLSMIDSFNVLKIRSQPTDFDPFETFNHVCSMYQGRLESEKYHALVERCPQEQINLLADVFNEYDNYFYFDYNQHGIIDTLEEHLLPLLTKTAQENRQIVAQIVTDFNDSRRNQQVGDIYRAQSLFEEACVKYYPLELGRIYQSLVAFGFDGAQLANLVALIGSDHRTKVMERLNRFVQECQNSEHAAAAETIRDGGKKNALLRSMINSFNSLKTSSQPADFDPLETFNHVCSMFRSRLEEEKYHVLVECCSQEEINSLADLFNEYEKYFYYNQSGIFETFEQHLLPLLTKTVQENRHIIAQIVADFNVSRRNQEVGDIYRARSLFEEACSNYRNQHQS